MVVACLIIVSLQVLDMGADLELDNKTFSVSFLQTNIFLIAETPVEHILRNEVPFKMFNVKY